MGHPNTNCVCTSHTFVRLTAESSRVPKTLSLPDDSTAVREEPADIRLYREAMGYYYYQTSDSLVMRK